MLEQKFDAIVRKNYFESTSIRCFILPTYKALDPRLPAVGEFLTKTYKGAEYQVQVLEDGFEFNGRHYRSLSRIAREFTNTVWNGFLFFGLTARRKA